jgi:glycosyltransferase involved in cell wall biosynthesis
MAEALMRVLAVSTLAEVAGGELMLLRVLPELQRRGAGVRLAVPGPGRLAQAAAARGITTTRIPLGPPDRRTPAALAGVVMAIGHLARADVAWLNGLPTQRLVPALALTRRRAILRVNNPLSQTPAAWKRPGFWRVVAAVTADSQASAEECLAAGAPADRVHVVFPPAWATADSSGERDGDAPGGDHPEGANLRGASGQREGAKLDPAAPGQREGTNLRVGFVGTLEPRKGVLELLESARTFLAGRPQARLTIVGQPSPDGGAYAERVRAAAAASGADDRIDFQGYVNDAARTMSDFDLLAVPSLAEPFGTVAAEAAARGVPVVASAVGGLVEVVGDGGILVPPGDPGALAEAVGQLLDDPDRRRRLGEQARTGAHRFDPTTATEAMEGLLRQAAEGTR